MFSFRNLALIVYSLLGLIPYMLAAYLAVRFNAELPATTLLVAVAVLVSHLFGLAVINRFGRQLEKVDNDLAKSSVAKWHKRVLLHEEVPKELSDIVAHFNTLVRDIEVHDRNYRDAMAKLMLYTQEAQEYDEKLKKEALIRQELSRYVSSSLVETIMHSDREILMQNRRIKTTVLFADIRSFTSIAEQLPPETVTRMLNEYFEATTATVFAYDGVLDKYVGDELMAIFGLTNRGEHADYGATAAVSAALAMQKTVSLLMKSFRDRQLPTFEVGIGINTGEVVVGNVGSKGRMDYTVIGDVVNVASRLEQNAKGSCIVIGEETYRYCGLALNILQQGEMLVRHREQPVKFFQIEESDKS